MENNQFILTGYFIYLPIVFGLTYYVSKILFQTGKQYMLDTFHGQADIANATNKLFEVGFYLLNIGFALYTIKMYHRISTAQALVENLSEKIGAFSIYLGLVLFFNLVLFMRGRKRARRRVGEMS